jgi:hypothetical protein
MVWKCSDWLLKDSKKYSWAIELNYKVCESNWLLEILWIPRLDLLLLKRGYQFETRLWACHLGVNRRKKILLKNSVITCLKFCNAGRMYFASYGWCCLHINWWWHLENLPATEANSDDETCLSPSWHTQHILETFNCDIPGVPQLTTHTHTTWSTVTCAHW